MLLSTLITALREDVQNPDLGFYTAKRALERATAQVNSDAGTAYVVAGDDEEAATITPDPTATHREALLILAMRHLVNSGRISASESISWKSADAAVDRSRHALSKEQLSRDLWKDYLELMNLSPDQGEPVVGVAFDSSASDSDPAPRDWTQ